MKRITALSTLIGFTCSLLLSACTSSQVHLYYQGNFNPGWSSDLYTVTANQVDFDYNDEEKTIHGVGKYEEKKLAQDAADQAWMTTYLYDFIGSSRDGIQFSGQARLVMSTKCTINCDTDETQVLYGGWYASVVSSGKLSGDFTDIISLPFSLTEGPQNSSIDYYQWDGNME